MIRDERKTDDTVDDGWLMLRCGRAVGGVWEVWGRHLCLLFFSSCTLIISVFFIARQRANAIDFPFSPPFSQELGVQKCISQELDDSPQRFYYIGDCVLLGNLDPIHPCIPAMMPTIAFKIWQVVGIRALLEFCE